MTLNNVGMRGNDPPCSWKSMDNIGLSQSPLLTRGLTGNSWLTHFACYVYYRLYSWFSLDYCKKIIREDIHSAVFIYTVSFLQAGSSVPILIMFSIIQNCMLYVTTNTRLQKWKDNVKNSFTGIIHALIRSSNMIS